MDLRRENGGGMETNECGAAELIGVLFDKYL